MATNFRLTPEMDIDTLSQVVKLREKNGLHVEYQNGLLAKNFGFTFPTPQYDGCSLRIFIYNKVSSYAKVQMNLDNYSSYNSSSVELDNTTVTIRNRSSWKTGPSYNLTEPIGLGRFFSIGLRMSGWSIIPLVNDWVGYGYDHGFKISERTWVVKIYCSQNYILSLHICDEVGAHFPGTGLRDRYAFNYVLPVGSYLTVFAVFVGGGYYGDTLWIGFQQDGGKTTGIHYKGISLKPNDEFLIFARNSNDGWLLSTSFNKDTEVTQRTNQEQFMHVELSDNCYIKRIVAVCAVIPEQHRP